MIDYTGWTWEEVGRLTIPAFLAMRRRWRRHPPIHHLAAVYWGYAARDDDKQQVTRAADLGGPPM